MTNVNLREADEDSFELTWVEGTDKTVILKVIANAGQVKGYRDAIGAQQGRGSNA